MQLPNGPTALETKLGWTLLGRGGERVTHHEDAALTVLTMFNREARITDLWDLDVLGIADPTATLSKEAHLSEIKKQFQETVRVNEEGRYEVSLPWKETHPPLGNNFWAAEKRLRGLTKQLDEEGTFEKLDQVFDTWIDEGIIEKTADLKEDKDGYFLPLGVAVKLQSTTPYRPIFDASAFSKKEGKKGPSLNQCLETGPNLIELIHNIILRFRLNKIGMTADIAKAFLQICVAPADRGVLKFLWWNKSEPREMIIYRHRRVVFGVNSSPFLLGATIEHHLQKALESARSSEECDFYKKLQASFYVDNCITSVRTTGEKVYFQRRAIEVMQQAKFDLRGWEFTGSDDGGKTSKILGISWDKINDLLSLNISKSENDSVDPVTKRKILSAAHKIFDPLGWVCPVLFFPKLMLQSLWSQKIEWDSEVPKQEATEFKKWQEQVHMLEEIKVPRWIFGEETDKVTLHMFVDASKSAYAAALFVRVEKPESVRINLVQAKSRVGPTKDISIPRMELLAATLGARLLASVKEAMGFTDVEVTYWSDSSTVLTWLRTGKQWSRFVYNRVEEIKSLSNVNAWRHVPGTLNPADLPSRGCSAMQLLQTRWWEGPSWLARPSDEWPIEEAAAKEQEVNAELSKIQRKTATVNRETSETEICQIVTSTAVAQESEKNTPWYLFNHSRYDKIVRIMGWLCRFVRLTRTPKDAREKTEELSVSELCYSEKMIFRLVQTDSFDGVTDPRLRELNVYLDDSKVLRTKSIISNKLDTEDFRFPVILDPSHELTKLLIRHEHERLKHAGASTTMAALREKVWILASRRSVRAVIRSCVVCRRYSEKPVNVPPTSLPLNRVRDAAVFEVVGVDYAGPLYIKEGTKAWICLFTCAVYRAIHLELVTSLSTTAFLEALRRFIARRGRSAIIYSDNGTNFVGAFNLLKSVDWKKISSHCAAEKIEWRFNPPSAAWWGGWWERLVRIVKDLLRRSLGKASLDYQEMSTVLCECEAIINARPLTSPTEEKEGLVAITPEMFLKEVCQDIAPDLDQIEKTSYNQRLRYLQRLRQELRNRFRAEYLGQLVRHCKTKKSFSTIEEGDIVLIASDNQKRLDWPLARVLQVIPGNDGVPRVAKLKTAEGELVRPFQRLVPLEQAQAKTDFTAKSVQIAQDERDQEQIEENNRVENHDPQQTVQIPEEKNDFAVSVSKRTRSGRIIKTPKRLSQDFVSR